jgi:hypothetical protein
MTNLQVIATAAGSAIACTLVIFLLRSDNRRKREARAFTSAVQTRLPGAQLTVMPLMRGGFGARIAIGESTFIFTGEYIQSEGGDGYMHIYEGELMRHTEIGKVPLKGHRFHWSVMTEGVEFIARYARKERAEPGATDNPDDAQRLREDH